VDAWSRIGPACRELEEPSAALDSPQSASSGSRKEAVPSSWQHHRFLATPWTVAARASSVWSYLMPTSISLFLRGMSLAEDHNAGGMKLSG
jgi:hypothetical protein